MFLLLNCWIIAGIAAEPPVVHYQLKNTSVCLHVRKSTSYDRTQWRFEKNVIAMDKITPNYTNKVDYFPGTFSLCIKELTDADSGTYTFSYVDSQYCSVSEEHRIIVQEMVPRPVIVTSVLRSNLSAGVCNISVNCSIQDDWLWALCDEDSCRTTQISLSKVNITLSIDNRTVVCSGKNHVSTNNVSESTAAACFSESNSGHKEASLSTPIITAFVLCVSVLAVLMFVARRLSSTSHDYTKAQTQERETEAAYENVDAINPSPSSSTREEPGSMSSQKLDTVYSVLQAPGKSERTIWKETRRHEASASQSEHPVQIDTMYSMLQKPKIKT